jgi:hypothetical protein
MVQDAVEGYGMKPKQETQWQRWQRIAELADVDWRTVRDYEKGKAVRDRQRKRIEKAIAKGTRR